MRKYIVAFLFFVLIIGFATPYTITVFNNSQTYENFSFYSSGYNMSIGINIPKGAMVSNAIMDVEGYLLWIWSSANERMTSYSTDDDNVSIDVSSNGEIHVVWDNYTTNGTINYANQSSNWEKKVLWTEGCEGDPLCYGYKYRNPRLKIGPNGIKHVVVEYYKDAGIQTSVMYAIYYRNSTNDWAAEDTVYSCFGDTCTNNKYPSLAVDSNNDVHVTWRYSPYSPSTGKIIKYANYSSSWKNVTIGYGDHPDIAINSQGIVFIVYQNLTSPDNYEIYIVNSSDWTSPINITNNVYNQTFPTIAIDSNDVIHVAWTDKRNGNEDIYYANSSNGWSAFQITSDSSNQTEPLISISSGLIHLVWSDYRNSNWDIYYANSTNGYANYQVTSDASSQRHPSGAATSEGKFRVAWIDDRNGNNDVYYDGYGWNPFPAVDVGNDGNKDWNGTAEYSSTETMSDFSGAIMDYLPNCVIQDGNCSVPINVSSKNAGRFGIFSLNVTYGTTLTGKDASLSFNKSDGTDVSTIPQYENATIYVYKIGGYAIASFGMGFGTQPNASGWQASGGNVSNNRGYALTNETLSSMNLNTTTHVLYVRRANTSLSTICFIDNSSITYDDLASVTNDTCENYVGGQLLINTTTTTINNIVYFKIPNASHSGAVQVAGGNQAPILTDGSVTPLNGNVFTNFTYNVTVTDPENDSMVNVYVYIDGSPFNMTEIEPSDTSTIDGKGFSYSTSLGSGTHTYYFQAIDNQTNAGSTDVYTGPTVTTAGGRVTIVTPELNFIAVLLLLFLSFVLYLKFLQNSYQ